MRTRYRCEVLNHVIAYIRQKQSKQNLGIHFEGRTNISACVLKPLNWLDPTLIMLSSFSAHFTERTLVSSKPFKNDNQNDPLTENVIVQRQAKETEITFLGKAVTVY